MCLRNKSENMKYKGLLTENFAHERTILNSKHYTTIGSVVGTDCQALSKENKHHIIIMAYSHKI